MFLNLHFLGAVVPEIKHMRKIQRKMQDGQIVVGFPFWDQQEVGINSLLHTVFMLKKYLA